ncbi:hypothetical protein ACLB2K_012180 [Fragaria x ananassa]
MVSQFCLLGPSELRRPNIPKTNRTLMPTSELQHPSLSNLKPALEFVFDEKKHPTKSPLPAKRHSRFELDNDDLGEKAWEVVPLQTLKLIFSLRAAGRMDDDDFNRTILWVYQNHPLTLSLNLSVFGELGLFKDLLGILHKVLVQSLSEYYLRTPYGYWWTPYGYYFSFLEGYQCLENEKNYSFQYWKLKMEKERIAKEVVAAWRRADDICKAKIALERFLNDKRYQGLHSQVVDVFAEFLKSDLKYLESGEIENISSAAKFCPSLDSSYDKKTLICESIAKRIFPREEYEEYRDIFEPHYSYRVRDRLRKQVLVPLRHALKSSQLNSDAVRKTKIPPDMVKALKSLEMYRKILNYEGSYLLKQCMKIVGMYGDGLKLPHQVINSLNNGQSSDEIAERQWQRLIQDLSKKGKLRNCVAVCDIPESMRGTTYESVCIAMGDTPKLHKIEGENLRLKCEFMKHHMESAKKLNFGDIYDKLLEIAIKEKLGHHQIPERIFVFTDKDFDMAFKNDWFDDYAKALYDYKSRGYVFNVPDMVLWNLKGSIARPMALYSRGKDRDVGMTVTGFSSNLLRLFLNAESDSRSYAPQFQVPYGFSCSFAPQLIPSLEDVFNSAVSRDELKNLVVFD